MRRLHPILIFILLTHFGVAQSNFDFELTLGQAGYIYAVGASNYTWSTGVTGSLLPVTITAPTVFTVTGVNGFGCQNSGSVSLGIHKCLDTQEFSGSDGVSVYPNPFTNDISMVRGHADFLSARLLDGEGRMLMEINTPDELARIDLSHLEKGLYFLQFQIPHGTKVFKLIKQ